MISNFLETLYSINPISPVEYIGRNVDIFNRQWKKTIKILPLKKEQKQFLETFRNFAVGNWYFFENCTEKSETLINFRKKLIINICKELLKKRVNTDRVSKLIQLGINKEVEIIKKDDKNLTQIGSELREQTLAAFFSNNPKNWLVFSRKHLDKHYWAGRGTKKLMDLVRDEYGLKNSTIEVYRTSYLRLLKVIPVYSNGEKPGDFKYTQQPNVIFPPTVLDEDIVGLLPNHGMSLVHYLSKYHPVYVMLLNDYTSKAVLNMTKEEFVNQTAALLKFVTEREQAKPIFSGYCQGGTIAVLTSLTEKIRPYVKAVFTMAAATGKKEEDSEISSLFLDDLSLVSEVVKNGFMIAAEFLALGTKKSGWSPFGDVLSYLVKGEKYADRINELIETKGYDLKKARKVLSFEIFKEIAIEIWLASMHAIPVATTEITLPVFRDGILSDGTYDLEIFGQKINVYDYNKYNIPIHIFAGKFDKVVPVTSAIEISKFVKNCYVHLFDGGHIGLATNLKGGIFQNPIIEAVEEIFSMS